MTTSQKLDKLDAELEALLPSNPTIPASNHTLTGAAMPPSDKLELFKMADDQHSWAELATLWVKNQAVRKADGITMMSTFPVFLRDNHFNVYANITISIMLTVKAEFEADAQEAFKTGMKA